ncbi:uncharacterized protein LOC121519885 [Cheilinus undulatus]|uniref:uncharacterized protein LOC121519885 n=1 Tax=Cheilinus undulatus TaxID=241271 RepID=UPI001BD59C93|nr:uncharacterized protein LOC121519885 [Cheilinus undulatus]
MRMWGIPLKCHQCNAKMHHSGIYTKPRTLGNSSSYLQQALEEAHSEEWARRTIEYLSDCELHKKRSTLTQSVEAHYQQPPPFNLPLAQWFESVHANEIVGHLNEMKGVITSTYGRILKLDSTKKITKKLAGNISDTATWMTNVSNECGQILNCVLTTAEGAGLDEMCQGIVQRYRDAGEPEPEVIYVDRDCCSERGEPPVLVLFRPWSTKVRLDIFHFMRRFTSGLTTEHHPLYGTFCSKLSSCIFEWDKDDISLKDAKRSELKRKHGGHPQLKHKFCPASAPRNLQDEHIAVEYLLAQSGRGDMLQPQPHKELDITLPDMQDEVEEDDYPDATMSDPSDILAENQPVALMREDHPDVSSPQTPVVDFGPSTSPQSLTVPSGPDSPGNDATSGPCTSQQDSRCDARGFPGWEDVDNLAEFLVSLNRTITALSAGEVNEIVRLYFLLHPMDKSPTKYTLKSKKKTLPGPWRASRKRSGSAPGQQAAERLFMTHGQAAQRPDTNRVSECVCIKLCKEYQQARNRPKDCKDKTLPIPQSIVQTYSHIKQLLEDSQAIQGQTNLVLVTINTTTVSSWLHERQKRAGRDSLLQGVQLPQNISVAKEPMPKPKPLPTAPVEHGHLCMEFQEPENRKGEAVIRPRRANRIIIAQDYLSDPDLGARSDSLTNPSHQQSQHPPAPCSAWPSYEQRPLSQTSSSASYSLSTAPAQYPDYCSQPQSFMPPPSPFGPWMYNTPPPLYPGWTSQPLPYPSQQYTPSALHPQCMVPFSSATAPSSSNQSADSSNRHRKWRLKKAALEDEEQQEESHSSGTSKTATPIHVERVVSPKTRARVTHQSRGSGSVLHLVRLLQSASRL